MRGGYFELTHRAAGFLNSPDVIAVDGAVIVPVEHRVTGLQRCTTASEGTRHPSTMCFNRQAAQKALCNGSTLCCAHCVSTTRSGWLHLLLLHRPGRQRAHPDERLRGGCVDAKRGQHRVVLTAGALDLSTRPSGATLIRIMGRRIILCNLLWGAPGTARCCGCKDSGRGWRGRRRTGQ